MMNLLFTVILISSLAVLSSSEELRFKTIDYSYSPMKTDIGCWDAGIWWNSSHSTTTDPGEYLWGSQYALSGHSPISFLSYFSANSRVHRNITRPNDLPWSNFTVDRSTSYILSTFTKLSETRDGNDIRSIYMKDLTWEFNPSLSKSLSNTSAGILAQAFDGTLQKDQLGIQVVFILSNQAGVLDVPGELLIVPKSVATYINIRDWKYENKTTNKLRLFTAIGSGLPIWTINHMNTGAGLSRLYVRMSGNAVIGRDQEIKDVSVSTPEFSELELLENPDAEQQLRSRYGDDARLSLLWIEFPEGADDITYDLTYGAGSDPFIPSNLGVVLGVIIGFVVAVIVVAVIAYCACQRPTEYQRVQ